MLHYGIHGGQPSVFRPFPGINRRRPDTNYRIPCRSPTTRQTPSPNGVVTVRGVCALKTVCK